MLNIFYNRRDQHCAISQPNVMRCHIMNIQSTSQNPVVLSPHQTKTARNWSTTVFFSPKPMHRAFTHNRDHHKINEKTMQWEIPPQNLCNISRNLSTQHCGVYDYKLIKKCSKLCLYKHPHTDLYTLFAFSNSGQFDKLAFSFTDRDKSLNVCQWVLMATQNLHIQPWPNHIVT